MEEDQAEKATYSSAHICEHIYSISFVLTQLPNLIQMAIETVAHDSL